MDQIYPNAPNVLIFQNTSHPTVNVNEDSTFQIINVSIVFALVYSVKMQRNAKSVC